MLRGRAQPAAEARAPSHDAYTRLLSRLEPDPDTLFAEVSPMVRRDDGVLIADDSTLDHFHATEIELVHRHWSGKHKRVVRGINLISLVWSDGDRSMPVDYRLYDKPADGLTKNDHLQAMLRTAHARGFRPRAVLFDSWYSGLENLKQVRRYGWVFLTQLKANRKVDPDRRGYRAVGALVFERPSVVAHLEGFGAVRVFRVVSRDGDTEHWATNDLGMDELRRLELAERAWAIEEYHRALKQCCNVERCQARSSRAQRDHIGMALSAFARPSWHFYSTGVSWYESKARIAREAIRAYRARPLYKTPSTA